MDNALQSHLDLRQWQGFGIVMHKQDMTGSEKQTKTSAQKDVWSFQTTIHITLVQFSHKNKKVCSSLGPATEFKY